MWYKVFLLIFTIIGLAELLPVKSSDKTLVYNSTSGCNPPFQVVNSGCYFFSEVQVNFEDAVAYCEGLSHGHSNGISLAMLDYGREEDQAILRAVTEKNKTYWVGGRTKDGVQWQWLDGRDIYLKAPYMEGTEPNEDSNQCLVAQRNVAELQSANRSYLFDHECTDSLNFICQNMMCPTDFIKLGSYCYLHSHLAGIPDLTWKESRDYCQSLDTPDGYYTDLAVLGLQDQEDYHLMNSLGANFIGEQWIGAYRNAECFYNWVDQRELPLDSIYWYVNRPLCDSYNRVTLYYTYPSYTGAFLLDQPSEQKHPFICQMIKSQ